MPQSTVVSFGYEHCNPDKKIEKGLFRYNMLHFVFEGEGYFGNTRLHAGQGFLCRQKTNTPYYPSKEDPWVYGWINIYDGELFQELCQNITFTGENIFEFDMDKPYASMLETMHNMKVSVCENISIISQEYLSLLSQSIYYNIYSLLTIDSHRNKSHLLEHSSNIYVEAAIMLINQNYHKSTCNVSFISDTLHISSGYLRNLFSEHMDMSPQEYLLKVRMEKATEYLINTDVPVSVISASVGYTDQLHFSKMYHKFNNISPSGMRLAHKNEIYFTE